MKILFIHDHPFFTDSYNIYSGGGLPFTAWNNYLDNFKSVIVYGRKSKNVKDKKVISSSQNVSFYLTEQYTSVYNLFKNKNRIEQELEDLIKNVDIVLVRLPSVLGFIASKVAHKNKKYLWVEQVGNAREALGSYGSLQGKIAAPFFEYYNKRIVRNAHFVSYVTAIKLQIDYPVNNDTIAVSLSDVIINKILQEHDLDYSKFTNNPFRIGLIGGFDARYKGQDILLKAIGSLSEYKKRNIKINLVGKGDNNWILNLANKLNLSQNIEYIGPLESGEQINDFLKSISLYVQPSLTEGMPRATIEAMAMGCPVIGSNVGGIPDIVSEKFIHKRGSVNELAAHIDYLYDNRDELYQEAVLSLSKAIPYLKSNLDIKRNNFYAKMNEIIKNE